MQGEGQKSSDARFSLVHIEMPVQMLDLGCRNNTSSYQVSDVPSPPSSLLPMLMRKLKTAFFESSRNVLLRYHGDIMQTSKGMKSCHLQRRGWNWRVLC